MRHRCRERRPRHCEEATPAALRQTKIHRCSRWFFLCACKVFCQPRLKGAQKAVRHLHGLLLATRKRAAGAGKGKLGFQLVCFELVGNVFLYFRSSPAHRIHVVAAASELAVTVLEPAFTKLLVQHQAALALEIPHERRYTHFRGNFEKHVNVVRATRRFQNVHTLPLAQLAVSPTAAFFSP